MIKKIKNIIRIFNRVKFLYDNGFININNLDYLVDSYAKIGTWDLELIRDDSRYKGEYYKLNLDIFAENYDIIKNILLKLKSGGYFE